MGPGVICARGRPQTQEDPRCQRVSWMHPPRMPASPALPGCLALLSPECAFLGLQAWSSRQPAGGNLGILGVIGKGAGLVLGLWFQGSGKRSGACSPQRAACRWSWCHVPVVSVVTLGSSPWMVLFMFAALWCNGIDLLSRLLKGARVLCLAAAAPLLAFHPRELRKSSPISWPAPCPCALLRRRSLMHLCPYGGHRLPGVRVCGVPPGLSGVTSRVPPGALWADFVCGLFGHRPSGQHVHCCCERSCKRHGDCCFTAGD